MQIVAVIRQQIEIGELAPGQAVPPVRQLALTWGVAHATAAKAMRELVTEGLVVTKPGGAGGAVVAGRSETYSAQDLAREVAALLRRRGVLVPDVVDDNVVRAAEVLLQALRGGLPNSESTEPPSSTGR